MPAQTAKTFLATLKTFSEFSQKTACYTRHTIPYFENEFWTSKQRQANKLHEISYRACFKPQLPAFFIKHLTKKGDSVFDPFMGRGTTVLEAHFQGRNGMGNDINPLSALLCRPRLNPPPSLELIQKKLADIPWGKGEISTPALLAFYHPKTLQKIEALKNWLLENAPLEAGEKTDPVADWIRMVALSRLSGHTKGKNSGFFSVRSLPPNQAVSVKTQLRLNQKQGINPENDLYDKDISALILRKSKSLLHLYGQRDTRARPAPLSNRLSTFYAWDLRHLADHSVALTITSPPFLDIVNYEADNWLRCWFAGIDPKNVPISQHKTEQEWQNMVHLTLKEQARILKSGGFLAFEVGEVRNHTLYLEDEVIKAAAPLPLTLLGVMVNRQNFTKTANCWGIKNNQKGTNSNRIVLFQRP